MNFSSGPHGATDSNDSAQITSFTFIKRSFDVQIQRVIKWSLPLSGS